MHVALLGGLEQLVLLAVSHLGNDGYGVSIRREIRERVGRTVSVGALYASLHRLEEKGLVHQRSGEPTPRRGGRAKQYYSLTPSGARALVRFRRAVDNMWNPSLGHRDTLDGYEDHDRIDRS